jgi:hypothetical protein
MTSDLASVLLKQRRKLENAMVIFCFHTRSEHYLLSALPLEFVDRESVKMLKRVDFPAPEGPRIAVTLPSGNSRFMSCRSFFPFVVETLSIKAYPSFLVGWNDSETTPPVVFSCGEK